MIVEINKIRLDKNARVYTEQEIKNMALNISFSGIYTSIIVTKRLKIKDGTLRYLAAKALGITSIKCKIVG